MKINIISNDARYETLNNFFNNNGYTSEIVSFTTINTPDVLILPIKSAISNEEYKTIFSKIENSTIVFCGESEKIQDFFKGKIIDYSKNEAFLLENAYITAECALCIALNKLEKTLSKTEILVIGYGRIGKYLASLFYKLGAKVNVFARRIESIKEAELNGCFSFDLENLRDGKFDIVFNTIPVQIIPKTITDNMQNTILVELASNPGGFEDDKKAEKALKLPGIMKKESAAYAIFDFIDKYLSSIRKV